MSNCVVLTAVSETLRPHLLSQAEEIFFETSLTQAFKSDSLRQAFLERWFGHYVETQPEAFLFALGGDGSIIGYLAGCFNSLSSGAGVITGDIVYYTPAFRTALLDYPSHFHINIKPQYQRSGTGRRLIERFVQLCRDNGSTGIHVVTGAASPAVQFYEACGFQRLAPLADTGGHLAVLVYATATQG